MLSCATGWPDFRDGHRVRSWSMGPKGRAACWFVEQTGGLAAIGSIEDKSLVRGDAGTTVTTEADGREGEGDNP